MSVLQKPILQYRNRFCTHANLHTLLFGCVPTFTYANTRNLTVQACACLLNRECTRICAKHRGRSLEDMLQAAGPQPIRDLFQTFDGEDLRAYFLFLFKFFGYPCYVGYGDGRARLGWLLSGRVWVFAA